MELDTASLIDKYTVSLLKKERIGGFAHKVFFDHYAKGLKELKERSHDFDWDQILDHMYRINSCIWNLETAIRRGMLDHDHEEVGKRAIMIREINSLRTGFGNIINKLVGEKLQNIKQNHISE